MTALLTLHNMHITYARHFALDLAAFTIPEQGCVVLSGANGSGKTTLLKVIAGLLPPKQACVEWCDGSQQTWQQAKRRLRQTAIYLHQQPYLFDASVAENVGYGLRRRFGLKGAALHQQVQAALDWAGLSHLANRSARCLSGGEKQRVALTRARVLAPQLLLLDEPTANMDRESKEQTYFLLRRLKKDQISIILTSHELRPDTAIGDWHWQLSEGNLMLLDRKPVTLLNAQPEEPTLRVECQS